MYPKRILLWTIYIHECNQKKNTCAAYRQCQEARLYYLQMLQYHGVLLQKVVGGVSIHGDSVWNQFLHAEHWIQLVSGMSGILQTQCTGTSSTDVTVDSVARLSLV